MVYFRTFIALFVMALCFSTGPTVSKPAQAQPPDSSIILGTKVILRAAKQDNFFRIPASIRPNRTAAPTATINVNYIGSWNSQAQAAFQYAVDIWAGLIISSTPIEVDAEWANLGSDVLGASGPNGFVPGSSLPVTYYPIALANSLAGVDLNNGDAEIEALFNSGFGFWYFGLDGNPPANRYDFVSVVLHELGHGLGFLGSAEVNSGVGSYGLGPGSYPMIYDRFIENGGRTPLLDYPNNSTQLAAQLTGGGGGLFFDGPQTRAANGGAPARIYTPAPWLAGSSYSHLDEATFNNTPNALMTYAVSNGESLHAPGPVTLAMFEDMGWGINSQEILMADLSITQLASDTTLTPGTPITLTLSIANNGTGTARNVTVAQLLPNKIVSTSWAASASLAGTTANGDSPYTWNLPDLTAGASGVIHVYGTIDPNLNDTSPFVIEATISTSDTETDEANNSSSVMFGGERIYLPFAIR